MPPTVFADIVSLNYYPNYSINGDEEELDDWTPGDDYTYLSLGQSKAFSLKYSYELKQPNEIDTSENKGSAYIYADYTTFNLDGNKEEIETGKYQSITSGLLILAEPYSNKYIDTYFSLGFGIGGSRFELSENKHRGTAEIFLEVGVSLIKQLYLSVGGKYQVIGQPTETMAEAYGFCMGLSVKY